LHRKLQLVERQVTRAGWEVMQGSARLFVLAAEGKFDTADVKYTYAYDRLQDASLRVLGVHLGNLEAEALIEGEVERLKLEVAAAARGVRLG
jgi:hypothetical protein